MLLDYTHVYWLANALLRPNSIDIIQVSMTLKTMWEINLQSDYHDLKHIIRLKRIYIYMSVNNFLLYPIWDIKITIQKSKQYICEK